MHRCTPFLALTLSLSPSPFTRPARCSRKASHRTPALALVSALALGAGLSALPAPALAQGAAPQAAAPASLRNFPEAALRGKLVVTGLYDARLDGKPIRMAPGMRLFSPQNTLVQAHTVLEKPFTVNYVLENSTGMLLTAWILGKDEAAQKRPGANGRSFLWFGAD